MADALAVTTLTDVPPDRYERIQRAAAEHIGLIIRGDNGTICHDGAVLGYSYDSESGLLSISVLKTPKVLWHQVSPQAVIAKIETAISGIA